MFIRALCSFNFTRKSFEGVFDWSTDWFLINRRIRVKRLIRQTNSVQLELIVSPFYSRKARTVGEKSLPQHTGVVKILADHFTGHCGLNCFAMQSVDLVRYELRLRSGKPETFHPARVSSILSTIRSTSNLTLNRCLYEITVEEPILSWQLTCLLFETEYA